MRVLLLAVLFLPAAPAARAQDEGNDIPAVERSLAGLHLGDGLRRARRAYPPAQDWPKTEEPRSGVTRYRVDRSGAKALPAHVETLYLGFRRGSLVEIEVVYDEEKSRDQTVEKLAGEYALIYGEAQRADERFWWSDRRTVLRVFPAEVPIEKDGAHSVAWRTAVQVFDKSLTDRGE